VDIVFWLPVHPKALPEQVLLIFPKPKNEDKFSEEILIIFYTCIG